MVEGISPNDIDSVDRIFQVNGTNWKFADANAGTIGGPPMYYLHHEIGSGTWGVVPVTCPIITKELELLNRQKARIDGIVPVFEQSDG